ncbi:MAG: molecular chaperone GrpE [Solirubrobacteraceae bacterium]|jgi:molecular chaperone GrpE|nr:molecular chaperone GrpE [Solirubrobacteraceae bacterium]
MPEENDQTVAEAEEEAGAGEEAPAAEPEAQAVEQDLDELTEKTRQADEYLALAQRTQADFENYRKRAARDLRAAEGRGVARLARELLPALDNLGRALGAAGDAEADEHLVAGVRLVNDELVAALGRVGIEPFSPEGEAFDPQQHEAISQQPVDGAEPGTITEVYQQGFRQGEAVLRPARVVVAA